MQAEQQNIHCPAFNFVLSGKCTNSNCIFYNQTHVESKFNCLKLDADVKSALDFTNAKSSKLLRQLAKSDDPIVQLEASKSLLHFAFMLGYHIQQFEKLDFLLCKCGARAEACNEGEICKKRQSWFYWLTQLFGSMFNINSTLTQREAYHLLIKTLLLFPQKQVKLPALLSENISELHLSKRIL